MLNFLSFIKSEFYVYNMKVKNLIEFLNGVDPESQFLPFDYQENQFYKITEKLEELGSNKYVIGIEKTKTAEWT